MFYQLSFENSPTMPTRSVGVCSMAEPEDYSKRLDAFTQHESKKESPAPISGISSRRASTSSIKNGETGNDILKNLKKSQKNRRGSMPTLVPQSVTRTQNKSLKQEPKKEDSIITIDSSTTSNSDVDDTPDLLERVSVTAEVEQHNVNLESENKRLQKLVLEYQQNLPSHTPIGHVTSDELINNYFGIADVANIGDEKLIAKKLKGKIQSLKAKRREEKIRCMQLQKSVETHSTEIEGLQRELNRSLIDLDELHKDRIHDKSQLAKLGKQLGEAAHRVKQLSAREVDQEKQINSLEEVVQKQNEELEATLGLLQTKVDRIAQLEYEIKHRMYGNGGFDNMTHQSSHVSEKGLKDSQDEVKKLKRQNMMLKLLVEELEEHRKRGDNESDIDSVYLRLPKDLGPQHYRPHQQQHHAVPFSVGHALGLDDDARSVDTDLLSVNTDGAVPFLQGYRNTDFHDTDDGNYHDSEPSEMNYNGPMKWYHGGKGDV